MFEAVGGSAGIEMRGASSGLRKETMSENEKTSTETKRAKQQRQHAESNEPINGSNTHGARKAEHKENTHMDKKNKQQSGSQQKKTKGGDMDNKRTHAQRET